MINYIDQRRKQKLGIEPTDQQKRAEQREKDGGGKLAKKAAKRIEEDKLYNEARKQYLKDHPICEAQISESCRKKSADIHHKKRRNSKDDRINPENFLACCRPCHLWIESHPTQAIELGFTELVNKRK